MTSLVRQVIKDARDRQPGRAKGRLLAEAIKPLVGGHLYTEKTISDWIKGRITAVPADALLAAAKVSGISLDGRLGDEETLLERLDRVEREVRELRGGGGGGAEHRLAAT